MSAQQSQLLGKQKNETIAYIYVVDVDELNVVFWVLGTSLKHQMTSHQPNTEDAKGY